jgi:hypothetical protein
LRQLRATLAHSLVPRSRTCRAITLASSPHRGNCAHSVWRTCCFHPATHHHRNSVISRLSVFLRRDRGAVRVLPIVSNASISPASFPRGVERDRGNSRVGQAIERPRLARSSPHCRLCPHWCGEAHLSTQPNPVFLKRSRMDSGNRRRGSRAGGVDVRRPPSDRTLGSQYDSGPDCAHRNRVVGTRKLAMNQTDQHSIRV